ncbi:DUF6207 family protein [Streptomyces mutabilis]|uniref:DUF6207 family protein n=1 Tax=Streptomyces mutabilis TaxID=67332 RepID=UPI0039887E41
MEPFNEAHVARPGLIVMDFAAADDRTALAFQQAIAARWATATAESTTRVPGEPGVRLRCYLDLHQPLDLALPYQDHPDFPEQYKPNQQPRNAGTAPQAHQNERGTAGNHGESS